MTNTPNPADAVKITREDFEEACALVESMKPGKSMVDVAARFLAAYRTRLASSTPEPVATTPAPDAVERAALREALVEASNRLSEIATGKIGGPAPAKDTLAIIRKIAADACSASRFALQQKVVGDAASTPPAVDDGLVKRLLTLRNFLNGEDHLEGYLFEDHRPNKAGLEVPFWWRERLSIIDEAIEALASKEGGRG